MSERVDVLAVMDAAVEWRGGFMGDFTSAAELEAARAAVAALIAERDALREALEGAYALAIGHAATYQFQHQLDQVHESHQEVLTKCRDALLTSKESAGKVAGAEPATRVRQVGFRYRVCSPDLRARQWSGRGVVAEWSLPTPKDSDLIEYQSLYVLDDKPEQAVPRPARTTGESA